MEKLTYVSRLSGKRITRSGIYSQDGRETLFTADDGKVFEVFEDEVSLAGTYSEWGYDEDGTLGWHRGRRMVRFHPPVRIGSVSR